MKASIDKLFIVSLLATTILSPAAQAQAETPILAEPVPPREPGTKSNTTR